MAMGIKEGACDEHPALYEVLNHYIEHPETNTTLYVYWNLNKNLTKEMVVTQALGTNKLLNDLSD